MESVVESDDEEEKEILEDQINLLKKVNVEELVPKEKSQPEPVTTSSEVKSLEPKTQSEPIKQTYVEEDNE